MPINQESNGARDSLGRRLSDVIEVRLPLKADYLSVLRATIGVVAGGMSFNYDEIIQLRVAISEAFSMAIRWYTVAEPIPTSMELAVRELAVRFTVEPDRLEILIPNPGEYQTPPSLEEEIESQALLESLMDEVEFGGRESGKALLRMAKHKSASVK